MNDLMLLRTSVGSEYKLQRLQIIFAARLEFLTLIQAFNEMRLQAVMTLFKIKPVVLRNHRLGSAVINQAECAAAVQLNCSLIAFNNQLLLMVRQHRKS